MICNICKKHATFEHAVFRGMTPIRVTLCPECTTKTGASAIVERIKAAPDRAAKHAAAEELLKAVGK